MTDEYQCYLAPRTQQCCHPGVAIPRPGLKDYALTSALRDHRFAPISASEVPALKCTVSLLCGFERAAHWADWTVRPSVTYGFEPVNDGNSQGCWLFGFLLCGPEHPAGLMLGLSALLYASCVLCDHCVSPPCMSLVTADHPLVTAGQSWAIVAIASAVIYSASCFAAAQVGVHGLIINFMDPEACCSRSATFLPEVRPLLRIILIGFGMLSTSVQTLSNIPQSCHQLTSWARPWQRT